MNIVFCIKCNARGGVSVIFFMVDRAAEKGRKGPAVVSLKNTISTQGAARHHILSKTRKLRLCQHKINS